MIKLNELPKTQLGPVRLSQIIVVAGITLFALGFFWLVMTLPALKAIATVENTGVLSDNASSTIYFLKIFPTVILIIAGISVMIWGWNRSVEEREFGISV